MYEITDGEADRFDPRDTIEMGDVEVMELREWLRDKWEIRVSAFAPIASLRRLLLIAYPRPQNRDRA